MSSQPSNTSVTLQSDPVYTLDEAAEQLRMSPDTLRNLRSQGKGPLARMPAGKLLFRSSALSAWLDNQKEV